MRISYKIRIKRVFDYAQIAVDYSTTTTATRNYNCDNVDIMREQRSKVNVMGGGMRGLS